MEEDERRERDRQAQADIAEQNVLVRASNERHKDGELKGADDEFCPGAERERGKLDDSGCGAVRDLTDDPKEQEAAEVGAEES
jgi:hypothetical protein